MKSKCIFGLFMSLPLWLAGCGGGGGGGTDSVSASTSSGTVGISSGTITGFGSVFVNGVKFNTDNASIFRGDDQLNDVRELEIGMLVRVEGSIDDRVASSVRFEEDVKGPADGPASGDSFSVMGQTVITDAGTVFNNTSLAGITAGDILEISGLRNANDDIVARFVELKTNPANVNRYSVIGKVRNLDSTSRTFRIDDLTVNYSAANVNDLPAGNPVEGQIVEVKDDGKAYASGSFSLTATDVEPQNRLGNAAAIGAKAEIESIVTRVISSSEFEIGDILVKTNASTLFLFGTPDNIVVGARLEVEGFIDSSSELDAVKVKFEDNDARVQANVENVNPADGTVTLLGVPVTITGETGLEDKRDDLSPFSLSDIQGGDYLEIRGFIGANGAVVATELRRDDNDSKVEIRAPASQKDPVAGTVTVLGITVNTSGSTQFRGFDDQPISASQFFDAIVEGLTVVQAKWDPFTDVSAPARELELED
ncbi:MAG: DUF5666 domain-containing protein [Thiogranum sp.]